MPCILLYLLFFNPILYPVCCGDASADLCGRPAERSGHVFHYIYYVLTLLYPVCCGDVPADLCGCPAERSGHVFYYIYYVLTLLYPVCCGDVPADLCGRSAERPDPGDCGLGWTFLPAPPLQVTHEFTSTRTLLTQIRFFKLKFYISLAQDEWSYSRVRKFENSCHCIFFLPTNTNLGCPLLRNIIFALHNHRYLFKSC
jgi:hypothetical protein